MTALVRRADAFLGAHLVRLVRIALLLQICSFAFVVAGTHGAFGPQKPTTTDFASFYAAGRLADMGLAGQAYETAPHVAMERAVIGPGVIEQRFLNPPPFLLLCGPLARLPYLPAFIVFEALTAALWLLIATRIAAGGVSVIAGTLLVRSRPLLAGAAFGALCFKPHFGVLIPVALLTGGHWRAILGAALSALGLCALSLLLFGASTWAAFLTMAGHARSAIETGIQLSGHVDLAGAARLVGAPAGWGWALQGAETLLAAGCVAWSWSGRRASIARSDPAAEAAANAVLVAATLSAMPFVLFYDLVMASIAAAWLARAARHTGWRRSEPATLAAAWALSLLAFASAAILHIAIGVAVGPILLAAALSRLRKTMAESKF